MWCHPVSHSNVLGQWIVAGLDQRPDREPTDPNERNLQKSKKVRWWFVAAGRARKGRRARAWECNHDSPGNVVTLLSSLWPRLRVSLMFTDPMDGLARGIYTDVSAPLLSHIRGDHDTRDRVHIQALTLGTPRPHCAGVTQPSTRGARWRQPHGASAPPPCALWRERWRAAWRHYRGLC